MHSLSPTKGPTPDRKYKQCSYNTRSSPELSGQTWNHFWFPSYSYCSGFPASGWPSLCLSKARASPFRRPGDFCRGDDCFKMEQITSLFQSVIIEQEDHLVEDSLQAALGYQVRAEKSVGLRSILAYLHGVCINGTNILPFIFQVPITSANSPLI